MAYTKEQHAAYMKQYRTNKRGTLAKLLTDVLSQSKANARKRGHEHDIDRAYITHLYHEQRGTCYWTGLPIAPSVDNQHPMQPSLDRLDNSVGYVPGNVVWVSWAMNRMRGSLSVDEFTALLELHNTRRYCDT